MSNSKYKRAMNENPEVASTWKGRILVQCIAEPTEKPLSKVQEIPVEVVEEAKQAMEDREYAVIAQIGQAVALPTDKKYEIKITIGGFEMLFKPFDQRNPSKYKRYDRYEQTTIKMPYVDSADFGKIIIQLMDKGKPICYYTDHITNYFDPNPQFKWVEFLPDQAVGKIRESHKAGMFSFKLSFHDVGRNGPINFKDYPSWSKKVPKRSNPVKIRAYIYQCRDLPGADAEGTSDPFISVWDTNPKPKKTEVVEDNNNPLFYEVLELDYEVADQNDLESYPPFIFDAYDHDDELFDSTPDFLGRAVVEPEDCAIIMQEQFEFCEAHNQKNCDMCAHLMNEIPLVPRWHPFHFAPGEPKCGEVLVSFAVVEHDFNFNNAAQDVDLRSRVEFKEFDVNMLILGLRDLQSPGILPVKKAFIKFMIKSLVPPNGPSLSNIQTQP